MTRRSAWASTPQRGESRAAKDEGGADEFVWREAFAEERRAADGDAERDEHLEQRALRHGQFAETAGHGNLPERGAHAGGRHHRPGGRRDRLRMQRRRQPAEQEPVNALRRKNRRGVVGGVELADGDDHVGRSECRGDSDEIVDIGVRAGAKRVREQSQSGERRRTTDGERRSETFAEDPDEALARFNGWFEKLVTMGLNRWREIHLK